MISIGGKHSSDLTKESSLCKHGHSFAQVIEQNVTSHAIKHHTASRGLSGFVYEAIGEAVGNGKGFVRLLDT